MGDTVSPFQLTPLQTRTGILGQIAHLRFFWGRPSSLDSWLLTCSLLLLLLWRSWLFFDELLYSLRFRVLKSPADSFFMRGTRWISARRSAAGEERGGRAGGTEPDRRRRGGGVYFGTSAAVREGARAHDWPVMMVPDSLKAWQNQGKEFN